MKSAWRFGEHQHWNKSGICRADVAESMDLSIQRSRITEKRNVLFHRMACRSWFFPVRASAQGSLCVLRTFGPYHQQQFERPRRISGTTHTKVSETRFSAYKNALTMRQFSAVFLKHQWTKLLKSSANLNGQKFRNAKKTNIRLGLIQKYTAF